MRLKDIREDMDITQRQLAEYLHIRQNTLSQYENGQRSLPIDTLEKLADYFGTSTDYILGRTDERRPYPKRKTRS
ncbi:MAG: helix-turn-helix transcriptional regulator [Clostridia bacterium]|nr:helix-turn-helix transcriptional regulator [Clostridia bacterium]